MTQAVVPYMAAARRGTVVNVGSVVGFFATPWAGVYRHVPYGWHAQPASACNSCIHPPTLVVYPIVSHTTLKCNTLHEDAKTPLLRL